MAIANKLTQAQRAAGIDRIHENIALTSGAGCGKTFVLARRYLELLNSGGDASDAMSSLVALTFTKKAALEMASRVRKMLKLLAKETTGDERRRVLSWLDELPEARISTIHGFCSSILRSFAIEAKIDPAFSVNSDDILTANLRSESADTATVQAVENQQTDLAEMLMSTSFDNVVKQVEMLIDLRGQVDLDNYDDQAETLAKWQNLLTQTQADAFEQLRNDPRIGELIRQLSEIPCSDSSDKLFVHRQNIIELVERLLSKPAAWKAEIFAQIKTAGNKGKAANWGSKDDLKLAKTLVNDLGDLINPYSVFACRLNDADTLAAKALATLSRLARAGIEIYDQKKRSRGILDFTDLLNYASKLVRDNSYVRASLSRGIRQLLIDECQDTDQVQMELISALAGDSGGPENDKFTEYDMNDLNDLADLADLDDLEFADEKSAEVKLFLVGDSKQSIYRFRGAQVEVFQKWCQSLGSSQHEKLDISFRTHEAGVAFINHLFSPLMGEDYSPITAFRTQCPDQPSVEIILANDEDNPIDNSPTASFAQSLVTAQRIDEMVRNKEKIVFDDATNAFRPVRYRDIAILMSRMTYAHDYEQALRQRAVPFHTLAGGGFFNQQEIYDILNALRVIDNPIDDIAFIGTLRCPMFGLDDNVMMKIALSCDQPYLDNLTRAEVLGKLTPLLTPDENQALLAATELILSLHKKKNALGIAQIITRLMDATGFDASGLGRIRGKQILGNIRQITALAHQADADAVTLADFISAVSEMTISNARFEQAAVTGSDDDVVRIMTIHKAKGLEFPVVFIPDLNAGKKGITKSIFHNRRWGLLHNAKNEDDQVGAAFALAKEDEKSASKREEIRQHYVAMTRHRDYLAIVGANWQKKGKFRNSSCPLQIINSALGITSTIDAGMDEIKYDNDKFSAAINLMTPISPPKVTASKIPGYVMLSNATSSASLAKSLMLAGKKASPPELLTPGNIPASQTNLAVTALGDFERCPMLYHLRHELHMTSLPQTSKTPSLATGNIDAMSLGSLLHKCMELLDFSNPQNPRILLNQAAGELDITINLNTIEPEITRILDKFNNSAIATEIADAAEVYRELDFIVDVGSARLSGQIDLLLKDRSGKWHIIDYKSDRVDKADIQTIGQKYELQMLIYALAVEKFLSQPPTDVKLLFLRPLAFWSIENPKNLATDRIEKLITKLLTTRESQQYSKHSKYSKYQKCKSSTCKYCPYAYLCT